MITPARTWLNHTEYFALILQRWQGWNQLSSFLLSARRQRDIYWIEWNRTVTALRNWECFIVYYTFPDTPPPIAPPLCEWPGGIPARFLHWERLVARVTDPEYNIIVLKATKAAWHSYWENRKPTPIGARAITKREAFARFISVHRKRTARAAALL